MRVDYQVGLLYEEGMKQIVSNAENWKEVCRMTGRLYRYEFDNILIHNSGDFVLHPDEIKVERESIEGK